jgi:hypothetical protein
MVRLERDMAANRGLLEVFPSGFKVVSRKSYNSFETAS